MAVEKVLQILASLVALIGLAPALMYLDPLAQITSLAALFAGFTADRRKRQLLLPVPATLLSCAFVLFYLVQMSRTNIVEPLINMLVLLLAVRLVTEKNGRNLLQIFVLSTFILAASSLLSLSAGYLVSLTLLIILVTFGLLLTSFYASDPALHLNRQQWRSLLRTGAILPLGSLLLMLFFFALLPRTEHPLWNFLNPAAQPTAGFSEEVSPGSLANLGSSGAPAFRAEMAQIDAQDLYWRGLVLNRTDGRRWRRDSAAPEDVRAPAPGPEDSQLIYSESRTDRYLPSLDMPLEIYQIANKRSADHMFEAPRRLEQRRRYRVRSARHAVLALKNRSDRAFYLQLPQSSSLRLETLAAQIATNPDAATKIQAARDFFIRQRLSYAARNLELSATPVETFLFDSRRGYCEYFASSFALLLRMAGVPARLVGGYLGGRYNELGGYYLVDEDMAHVWVEALDDANHWRRIDPSRLAINAGEAVTGLARRPFSWSQSLTDLLGTSWNRLVITYDLQKQLGLLVTTGRSLQRLKPHLPGGYLWWLLLPGLIPLMVLLARRINDRRGRQPRLLSSYLHSLCKATGLEEIPRHLGLFTLARLSQDPLCEEFARIYCAALYGGSALNRQERRRLKQIVRLVAQRRIHFKVSREVPSIPRRSPKTVAGKD